MQVLKFKRKPLAPRKRGKVFRSLVDELNGVPEMPPEKLNTDFQKQCNCSVRKVRRWPRTS